MPSNPLDTWVFIGVVLLVWFAAAWDIRSRCIPNWLTFGAMAIGLALHLLRSALDGIYTVAGGVAVGVLVFSPGFLMRATGAGDVKLMAATGAFLGPYATLVAGVASVLCGSCLALATTILNALTRTRTGPWKRYELMLRSVLSSGSFSYVRPAETEFMGRKFPFAVAIAVGVTIVVLWLLPDRLLLAGVVGENV